MFSCDCYVRWEFFYSLEVWTFCRQTTLSDTQKMGQVPSVDIDRGKHIGSLLKWAETRVEKVLNSFALHCLKMESRCTYKILFLSFQYGNLSRDQLALLHCWENVSQHANFYVSIHLYIQHCTPYSQFVYLILVLIKPRTY
jgi:hypothetical protein